MFCQKDFPCTNNMFLCDTLEFMKTASILEDYKKADFTRSARGNEGNTGKKYQRSSGRSYNMEHMEPPSIQGNNGKATGQRTQRRMIDPETALPFQKRHRRVGSVKSPSSLSRPPARCFLSSHQTDICI